MRRLAIVTSHPIQYNAPLFKLLTQRGNITIKVFYTWSQAIDGIKYDPGFSKSIQWDIPLLEGYNYSFVKNTSGQPGTHHFKGISNPTLNNEIENWNPDAVLVYGWSFKSHLKCLRYFHKKIPVIFRGDSTLLDVKAGIKKIFRSLLLNWVYSHVDYALFVGTQNQLYFLQHGLKKKQLIFAPHAVDNERFYDKNNIYSSQAIVWRSELGIKSDDIVFLFAGKLEPKKNIELLLKAFEKINLEKIHLVIVGNGILEFELKKKYSKTANVHFLDFQNQLKMPVVYNLCDVFVLPSQGPGETWGLAVNEAMACSKTVIVSNKCGCANDLVKDGINGFIFKSNDEPDLLKKINNIIYNSQEIKNMGSRSYKIIQNFSLNKICEQIENLVQTLFDKYKLN